MFDKHKIKELVCYGIFGSATTIFNIIIYQIFYLWVDYKIANLIAIIGSKIFAYVVNKQFVFKTKCENIYSLFLEMFRFIITRGFTGILDYFGLILLVEVFACNQIYSKYFLQLVVIVLNYIFGKKTVFVNKNKKER